MSTESDIKYFVGKKIGRLQAVADIGAGKAALANLRRGIGHEPGELPQLFGTILMDMPESFMSDNGKASKEEWSCYIALTLYAMHQQGFDAKNSSMHTQEEISIGRALARLASASDDANAEDRMLQKLHAFATSVDMKEASYHLRNMIQLLCSKGIPVNYAMLAADLYEFQFPDGKNRVNLRWGQDFYREKYHNETKENKS